MIASQQLAELGSTNKIKTTQKRTTGRRTNLEFVGATTDMDDHGAVHCQQGVGAIQHLRFTNTRNALSNLILCIASDLI